LVAGPDNMAGLNGPDRNDVPQGNGVFPVPGNRDEGEVREATDGSFPGVS
jgi:hypothetical protein